MTFEEAKREADRRNQQQPGSCFPPAFCEDHKEWYIFDVGCPTCNIEKRLQESQQRCDKMQELTDVFRAANNTLKELTVKKTGSIHSA